MTHESRQLRAVGTAFLLKRPVIVAPGILLSVILLRLAQVPRMQMVAMGATFSIMFLLFCVEAIYGRKQTVSERWLSWSLLITVTGLSIGCAISGGVRSPLIVLMLAPVVVAFAAFGRRGAATRMAGAFVGLVTLLALLPSGWPWPPIPPPFSIGMTAGTSVVALMLAYVGVAQLSDSLARSQTSMLHMRQEALLATTQRLTSLEAFGAKVAHELKNPLASIKGLAQLAHRTDDARTQKRAEVLLTAAVRMEEILEDYLSFARPLDTLRLAEVNLDAIVNDVIALLEGRAQTHRVTWRLDGQAGNLQGDRQRLLEVLINVLSNALEASPPGGQVSLQLTRKDKDVEIKITDEGAGLSTADLQRLGTPYFTTKPQGTGLGVVIAMAAVRQHGGQMTFQSQHAEGMTVSIQLPLHPPKAASSEETRGLHLSGG